jgi:hypothetical protein
MVATGEIFKPNLQRMNISKGGARTRIVFLFSL